VELSSRRKSCRGCYLFATNDQITGPAVVSWDYDQFSDTTAYAHVAVDPDMQ
jgi:hypothetical protein